MSDGPGFFLAAGRLRACEAGLRRCVVATVATTVTGATGAAALRRPSLGALSRRPFHDGPFTTDLSRRTFHDGPFTTAWPPNWFRRAATTFMAGESSWRDANRAKSDA